MPYTLSKAQTGAGTLVNINTGTPSTPTWTVIGEIQNFSQSGKQNATDETTNLQSTGEEFLATFFKPGKFDFTYSRVSGDTGQVALKTSFDSKTILGYQVVLPKTPTQSSTGDTYTFSALVEEMADISDIQPTKKILGKASLKVSGAITLVAGS